MSLLQRIRRLVAGATGRLAFDRNDLLFVLLGRLAKSEGRVLSVHIAQARAEMRTLQLDEKGCWQAIVAFGRGKGGEDRLRLPLQQVRADRNFSEALLQACWRMAWADGRLGAQERALVLLWGKWLGWTAAEIEGMGAAFTPVRQRRASSASREYLEALEVIGVTANSSFDDIKQAYRRLLSRHHPDKLAGQNVSPREVERATAMTLRLHQAYQVLRQYYQS